MSFEMETDSEKEEDSDGDAKPDTNPKKPAAQSLIIPGTGNRQNCNEIKLF